MQKSKLEKLQRLLASNELRAAEKLCRKELKKTPGDVNMIALLGAVLLKTSKLGEAEQRLREAIALAPKFAKPYDDLGFLYVRQEKYADAEAKFRAAVTLMPGLGSSWYGLVHALRGQDNIAEAKAICAKILEANPGDPNAIRLRAGIAVDEGSIPEAMNLLQGAVDRYPDSINAVIDLANFAEEHFHYAKAIEMYRRAAEIEPNTATHHLSLARCLFTVGLPAEALTAYTAGLGIDPKSRSGHSGRLHALRSTGDSRAAVAGYREAIEAGVNVCESWWALSSMRTYKFDDTDVASMQSLRKTADLADADGQYLDFALGKAMDDRGRYDDAWQYYVSGNTSRRAAVSYDGVQFEARVDAVITALDEEVLARAAAVETQAVVPVFIVGMPRSGSTLIEQILASHPEVEATTELPYMAGIARRCLYPRGDATLAPIATMDAKQLAELGAHYLHLTELNRQQSKACFLDKEPDNFLYAGLIAAVLPNAKIIDARRHPLDTCVGNYRQWFATGKEYTYDLYELADYYLQYWRVMQYWDDIMPGRILRVDYEKVVADTEAEVRRLVEWCGLPWDERCLKFHESDRVVTSASSEQVRQPIYKSAVGFWKNYDAHLEELKEILEFVSE